MEKQANINFLIKTKLNLDKEYIRKIGKSNVFQRATFFVLGSVNYNLREKREKENSKKMFTNLIYYVVLRLSRRNSTCLT